jgi:hypothetical protein
MEPIGGKEMTTHKRLPGTGSMRDLDPDGPPDMSPAHEKFLDEAVETGAILGAMADELQRVGKLAEAKPRDYGYAGSMGHVRAELAELLATLRGIK